MDEIGLAARNYSRLPNPFHLDSANSGDENIKRLFKSATLFVKRVALFIAINKFK
jgi:hypothetical protein